MVIMMRIQKFTVLIPVVVLTAAVMSGCVSSKKYKSLQAKLDETELELKQKLLMLDKCQKEKAQLEEELGSKVQQLTQERNHLQDEVSDLQRELDFVKRTNETLMDHISELSHLNKAESENLRRTLEEISEQRKYIKTLTEGIRKRDSLNLVLVQNLKRSLGNIDDEDIQIEVRKGVVYISIADKLLFGSGSAVITKRAMNVLEKVAKVLKDRSDIEVMVEGHTDNVPIRTDCVKDNWDLSVKRATAVVRVLQNKFGVNPTRLIAAGRGEYMPKATNETAKGRQLNRRTEIIITPTFAKYFELLKPSN